ncbi:helix-turn-helix transcriptional regulator [Streptomyces sp. NPDC091972]|uniref:helix-turn-helix transcriptional regulator n=1 Tax=Streptomyces sp. NPDC091972 TaxID=3366007 RepID=UPI0038133EF3
MRVDIAPSAGRRSITVPLGPMRLLGRPHAGRQHVARQAFLVDPDDRSVVEPDPDGGALMISTTIERLEDHLTAVTGRSGPPLRFWPTGTAAPGASHQTVLIDSAWRSVCRALRGLDTRRSVPEVEAALEDTLLSAFLFGLPHSRSTDLYAHPVEVGADGDAKRARVWIEQHYAEPITVAGIARAVGVSVRQLQYVCVRAYGVSPMALVRAVRLDEARRLLLGAASGEHDATVSAIAHRCGFGHLGRFAAAYRERFGETPSTTARRTRP